MRKQRISQETDQICEKKIQLELYLHHGLQRDQIQMDKRANGKNELKKKFRIKIYLNIYLPWS